jgi:UPF0755 protein
MKSRWLLSLCLIPFLFMLFVGVSLKQLTSPMPIVEPSKIDVLYGDSIYKVAQKLKEQRLFDYPQLLIWYARFTDMAQKIKAGEYEMVKGDTPLTVLDRIVKHKVIQYKVTFIEGWTAKQAIEHLQKQDGIVSTLDDNDSYLSFLHSLKGFENYKTIEGWIFPSTYKFHRGTKDRTILRRAILKMRDEVDALWPKRAKGLPYTDKYQVLTMASIVEKETGLASEREQIAGVFVGRLNKKMRLQADPTVIYGMGERYQGDIKVSHLREYTPYNTYRIRALPPSPIALPGLESIKAALNPLENGMLYFVARGDGSHIFTKTLPEHQKAVKQYQLMRDKNTYRSTP